MEDLAICHWCLDQKKYARLSVTHCACLRLKFKQSSEPDNRPDTLLSCKTVVSQMGILSCLQLVWIVPNNSNKMYLIARSVYWPSIPVQKFWLFQLITSCSITLNDIFDYNDDEPHCTISKCGIRGIKKCKTCNIIITDFSSLILLRKKTFTQEAMMT